MKTTVIAVGTKMPGWVETGVNEYLKRLPDSFGLSITEIPLGYRKKNSSALQVKEKEGDAILEAVPEKSYIIALDEHGKLLPTMGMAKKFERFSGEGVNPSFLIGGPDGLSNQCLDKANEIWSLSPLTLPHTVVRIVIAEQMYRIWSVLQGHPYHRE